MSVMGTRVLRTEDPKFLTVGGTYVDDLRDERLTGAAWVTYVRSAVAHAKITGIDAEEARRAPGVLAVITGADLPLPPIPPQFGMNPGFAKPWLATDVVRYVGEPVAAVITEQRYQGEDAAELVVVDYDALDPLVDPRQSATDQQLLFPDAGTNIAAAFAIGDVDGDMFDGCEVVVRQDVVNSRVAPAPLEVRGTACAWGDDGRLTIWTSTQNPHAARDAIAASCGVEPAQVHLITPDVGGGFGAKIGTSPEDILVAILAKSLDRPLRWTENRSENMQAMGHGRAQHQKITIGGSRDGKVTAYALEVVQDAGAYPNLGAFLPFFTQMMAPGVYDIPNIAYKSVSVVTNTCHTLAYRGAGRPEATAAIERAIDCFAAEIAMDPADVRRKNFIAKDAFPHMTPTGANYDSGDYAGALDKVLAAAGYDDLRAEQKRRRDSGAQKQLGIGVSAYVEITNGAGPFDELARVEVHPSGDVTVWTGTSPHGQGHATSWAMLASDELGIPVERITVKHGDTDEVATGGGTMGSRSLQAGGVAVHEVAVLTVERAKSVAADLLEAAEGDIQLDKDRGVFHVAGSPDEVKSWPEVAAAAAAKEGTERGLVVEGSFTAQGATFPFGAHLAVVEVDTGTGRVDLTRVVSVDDAGKIVNPIAAEGQRHGGIAQGAAQALLEEMRYDPDGNPVTGNFADYGFITADLLPSFELVDMATPTTVNPLGVKGIGESGTIGATPAVQNAVIDAVAHLGIRHIDMPTTSEKVWRAIQEGAAR